MPDDLESLRRLRAAGIADPDRCLRKLKQAHGDPSAMLARVCAGEPLYRVIGKREFHGLDFALSEGTLEPRDDTEAVIEAVLNNLPDRNANIGFADLGTGTGIIALSLLSELPNARAVATDISEDALATAKSNAVNLGYADRFETATGSWLEPLAGTFDVIVSNPPYIATEILATLDPHVRDHDPRAALDGGADGLDAYRAILAGAAHYLKAGGFLALEIGFDQRESVYHLAETHAWRVLAVEQDLGRNDRAMILKPKEI